MIFSEMWYILLLVLKCVLSQSEFWKDIDHHHHHHQNRHNSRITCPNQCVCQHAHFMDLSIARWINSMQMERGKNIKNQEENLVNDNEASFDGDESFLSNPFIKMVTCILQPETNPKDLFNLLPEDIQALVILYTGEDKNKTIHTSDISAFSELTTLEIRGSKDRSLQLIIDEPLSFLQNVNFESIKLIGNEKTKRPKNPIHPSESFDYVPNSERAAAGYNISLEMEEEIEILPYDVYIMEIKKSRMASFYEWDNLVVLRIHGCKLDELHWEMFDGLNELQHLSLERNEIKIVPAFALYGALHIKTLSLAQNSILDLNYRSLAGLLDLEYLDLSRNNITKLSELTFPPFPKLEYIDFRYNPIRYIFPATFGIMNNTKIIYLETEEAEMELIANEPFESLNHLKLLSISNVSITILDQRIFSNLKTLEVLRLKGSIPKIEFDAFAQMKNLREINLNKCRLQEISMDAFIGCNNLEIIDLSNNNLSYIPPGLFDEQKNLKEVYLHNNNLRFLPSTFFNNPSFKLVRLNGNPWKCSCDMATWKPSIINKQKGRKEQRCIKDFHSEKIISCRTIEKYKINNKLAPSCANVKGHSVYYAVRKHLQCNLKKELERSLRKQNRGVRKGSKYKHLEGKTKESNKQKNQSKQSHSTESAASAADRRAEWKNERTQKILNSIQYLSSKNNYHVNDTSQMKVLGKVDEHDFFNSI